MTNGWVDIKNTDMMLIMGGNPAENHPCGFKWVVEARKTRNAGLVVVDPRFQRTASQADLFCQIRAGTDVAFLGGLINYAIKHDRYAKDYITNYTNAALIIKKGFKLPEDGLFSGFDPAAAKYDVSSWNYEEGGNVTGTAAAAIAAGDGPATAESAAQAAPAPPAKVVAAAANGKPVAPPPPPSLPANTAYDLSLEHPRCVFQLMKKHFSRYTPEMVSSITGIPAARLEAAYEKLTSIRKDGDTKKVGTIIYSVGWTQHSNGTQMIRTAAMYQMLMGNVGRAGGGVNALRGHSNIQGATDMAGVFDILPGYLKVPIPADTDWAAYLKRVTPTPAKPKEWDSFNYWSNTPKFAVSFLKALYGDAAKKENEWCFNYLPRIGDKRFSWADQWDAMYQGKIKGLIEFGMNGVSIGPNSQKNIDALKKAEWLVVCEIYPEETAEFWRSPGITADEQAKIKTEVYRLPGAGFAEKDGTFVNSARWLQWKWAAVPPPGDCRLDHAILAQIFLKVRELYQKDKDKPETKFPDPILNLTWAYTNPSSPSLSEVAKEINGKALADLKDEKQTPPEWKAGQQLPGFAWLRDDGTTSCGNWLYCGSWPDAGSNTQRRNPDDPSGLGIHPQWGWSWPMNRRVLYNRASCNLEGKPWDPSRKQVWFNAATGKWAGNDVPDFKADSDPKDHMGPFIMNPEGVGRLFVPLGPLADGPFPEHYEPFESPIANPLHAKQSNSPVAKKFKTDLDKLGTADKFPYPCTTYRLTEHYHYWTKNNRMNMQLQPEPFVEMSEELAEKLQIKGGDRVKVSSARSAYYCKAMVTKRIKPLKVGDKDVYPVGIPIHWGYEGLGDGREESQRTPVNLLSPAVIDPNAFTPEFKGFLVNIEKA